MNYSYKEYIAFFSIIMSLSSSLSMDKIEEPFDLESASELVSASDTSYSTLPQRFESINPFRRKRSAWTNFYTVAGGLMATGITSTVTWHLATTHTPDELDDAGPWVYGAGTVVAVFGLCCYFGTYGADILHTTCKKISKKLSTQSHCR